MSKNQWREWLWEAWCIVSGIGIWPRYIEPNMLSVSRVSIPIAKLPQGLIGLKILHFSDLHWGNEFSSYLKNKLIRKVNALQPDLILFTGDFLVRAKSENLHELQSLLQSLHAKIGCFAVLGNHDYARFVTVNAQGEYDVEPLSKGSNISKGFKRLFSSPRLTGTVTLAASQVGYHKNLLSMLKETPFQLLNNRSHLVTYQGHSINICGLEDYFLGRCNPEKAFQNYHRDYPGIILVHNPDAFPLLKEFPGDLILSGHTHGGQVNLPILWKRLIRMENSTFKRGIKNVEKKWGYINRGISSAMKFRWFAIPELTLITLTSQ